MANVTRVSDVTAGLYAFFIFLQSVVRATYALIGNQTTITLSTGLYTSVAVNERLKIIGLPNTL